MLKVIFMHIVLFRAGSSHSHSFESSLYYKRRLSTYKFTINDMCTTEGYCYVWNEAVSSTGACEIALCVFNFIEKMAKKGKK